MTFCVEIETEITEGRGAELDFEAVLEKVATAVLDHEGCPYEASVNLLITDDKAIQEINMEQRGLDKSTDVLSFPAHQYEVPADFADVENHVAECFDPESGELLIGDIVISIDHLICQAKNYGHTTYRELAFLIAHSMLHLIGYDHMVEDEEKIMFGKQEEILSQLGINR